MEECHIPQIVSGFSPVQKIRHSGTLAYLLSLWAARNARLLVCHASHMGPL